MHYSYPDFGQTFLHRVWNRFSLNKIISIILSPEKMIAGELYIENAFNVQLTITASFHLL